MVKNLANRMKQIENRISGTEDIVEELDWLDKDKNAKKIWMKHARPLAHH